MAKPHPLVVAISARIISEELRTRDVLARAKVGRATWHRAIHGKDVMVSTLDRMAAAIDTLIAEKKDTENGGESRL